MPAVYSYHQITKIFTGAGEALPSPNEEGVWLLPAFATFVVPPDHTSYETVMWNDTEWVVVPAPVTQVEEALFGWLATDEEKHDILMKLATEHMDAAAKALGFAGIVDATAMAVPEPANQVERDAVALRSWRTQVLEVIFTVIAGVTGNTKPMPAVVDILNSFPSFKRLWPPMTPPV